MHIMTGKKVYLAKPTIQDSQSFLQQVKNSGTLHAHWVTPPADQAQYTAYLERIAQDSQAGFFIKQQKTDALVGAINLNEIVYGCFQSAYLGYYSFSDHRGKGLMSEGLHLLMAHIFNTLTLHRLEANIQPDNAASIALVQKNHFRQEGYSPRYLKINGVWADHLRFACTAEDFKQESS